MGPRAVSRLLQVPLSPASARSRLLLGSLQISLGSLHPFQGPQDVTVPFVAPFAGCRHGWFIGLQCWGRPGWLCGMA